MIFNKEKCCLCVLYSETSEVISGCYRGKYVVHSGSVRVFTFLLLLGCRRGVIPVSLASSDSICAVYLPNFEHILSGVVSFFWIYMDDGFCTHYLSCIFMSLSVFLKQDRKHLGKTNNQSWYDKNPQILFEVQCFIALGLMCFSHHLQ